MELLLEHNADINGADADDHETALIKAANLLRPEVVQFLIEHGADVNATSRDGDKPLTLAKECKFPELAQYLISQGGKE